MSDDILKLRTADEARAAFGAGSWQADMFRMLVAPEATFGPGQAEPRDELFRYVDNDNPFPLNVVLPTPPRFIDLAVRAEGRLAVSDDIFIVVLEDRHTEAAISVHRTRAGADARVEEHKAEYAQDGCVWTEQAVSQDECHPRRWLMSLTTDDGDPRIHIEAGTLAE